MTCRESITDADAQWQFCFWWLRRQPRPRNALKLWVQRGSDVISEILSLAVSTLRKACAGHFGHQDPGSLFWHQNRGTGLCLIDLFHFFSKDLPSPSFIHQWNISTDINWLVPAANVFRSRQVGVASGAVVMLEIHSESCSTSAWRTFRRHLELETCRSNSMYWIYFNY